MQNVRVRALHWSRPPMPEFRIGDTNMLVSKNAEMCVAPGAKPKTCVTPNAKPQRLSVKYRLRWVPNAKFSHWQCTFHLFLLISFAFGGQRKPSIQWSMGFRIKNTWGTKLAAGGLPILQMSLPLPAATRILTCNSLYPWSLSAIPKS